MVQDAKSLGASIHTLDRKPDTGRVMEPHLITGVTENMLVAQEEIFGPILPILQYRHINEAIAYVKQKPRPLALYLLSENEEEIEQVSQQTHSGGLAINDTILQVAAHDAPFGGIGESGIGNYHGYEGFQRFSHAKTTLSTPIWWPRTKLALKQKKLVDKVLKWLFVR